MARVKEFIEIGLIQRGSQHRVPMHSRSKGLEMRIEIKLDTSKL